MGELFIPRVTTFQDAEMYSHGCSVKMGNMLNPSGNSRTGGGFIFKKAGTWGEDDIPEVCL